MIFEKQDYQQECVENIIDVLRDYDFDRHDNLNECLDKFYAKRPNLNLHRSDRLNLDVLMETGTGKTFTYLNAIFEINKTYGQNKFIIFVPRKAILESLKQNIKLTKDYFYGIYRKHLKIYDYSGDKSVAAIVNHFVKNNGELGVLILTNSAMDKKSNLLNKPSESLFGKNSILENIAELKPVCVIDEPHLLKGDKFNEYFSKIGSLYLRFGATFPNEEEHKLSNLIYLLDGIGAFKSYLVKQIYVHTMIDENLKPVLKSINAKAKTADFRYFKDGLEYLKSVKIGENVGAKLNLKEFENADLINVSAKDAKVYLSDGEIFEAVKENYELSRPQISRLIETAIDLHFKKEERLFKKNIKALCLFFIPGIAYFRGEEPFIKDEFEKIYKEKRKEILKCEDLDEDYREFLRKDFDEDGNLRVANGYFSGDKGGTLEEKEASGVRLILEDKENLLSFKTPLRFIFSVWALQEGWDNPNVFTLVKLASSSSQTSRHQQIGRGLRLCVNQNGKRITHGFLGGSDDAFYDINNLDVVINGAEAGFISSLQKEIANASITFNEEFISRDILCTAGLNDRQIGRLTSYLEDSLEAIEFNEERNDFRVKNPLYDMVLNDTKIKEILGDKFNDFANWLKPSANKNAQIVDANQKPKFAGIKANLAIEFRELWQSINAKCQMSYDELNDENLVLGIAKAFDELSIAAVNVKLKTQRFDAASNKIIDESLIVKQSVRTATDFAPQNLLSFAQKEKFPLNFIFKIYDAISKKEFFVNDGKLAFKELNRIIKECVHQNIINQVRYDFVKTDVTDKEPFTFLFHPNGKPREKIETFKLGRLSCDETPANAYLYDKAVFDSQIEKDVILNETLIFGLGENDSDKFSVKVFAKLPKFSIPTPYKSYEPDFAYLLEDASGKKIFFICETKGYDEADDISQTERQKIDYARKFFADLKKFIQKKGINADVKFNVRLNKQTLIDILRSINDN